MVNYEFRRVGDNPPTLYSFVGAISQSPVFGIKNSPLEGWTALLDGVDCFGL
jgi:hypothetical protein